MCAMCVCVCTICEMNGKHFLLKLFLKFNYFQLFEYAD